VAAVNGLGDDPPCPHVGHEGPPELAAELRALALLALDRVEPVLARLRQGAAVDAAGGTAPAGACPVCIMLAAVRRERPELAARLGEHAAGLVAALRDALDGTRPASAGPVAGGRAGARRVQHIPVDRLPDTAGGTSC
jgi:hypothetical protein